MVALDAACSKYIAVNRAAVRKMYDSIYQVAEKTWDAEIFGDALEAENTRRRDEVAATGEEHWCRYQEGYLKHTGKGSIFYK